MAKHPERNAPVVDSHTPSATLLEPDESFLVENYDPYLEPIVEDVDPEDVLREPPSRWERFIHALTG